jgi:hypothetical protein
MIKPGVQQPPPGATLDPSTAQDTASPAGEVARPAVNCSRLPDHQQLSSTLRETVVPGDRTANGGLGNHMWAVIVNRDGQVWAVAHSGERVSDQWPSSRAIAAAKANVGHPIVS